MKSKEEWKVYGNVFSNHSEKLLFQFSSQGYFEELESAISVGKEANIFSARTKDGERIIAKMYRLENCNFNKMYDYLVLDPRYMAVSKRQRLIIFAWAQREYKNLLTARKAIKVPKPIAFKDNIVLMEFIGHEDAAPQLKDSPPKEPKKFFEKVLKNMGKLYKGGLVHVDLSQFNILNLDEEPVFIDFSQSLPTDSSHAKLYLKRDIKNVCTYFRKFFPISEEDEIQIFEKIVKQGIHRK
ncbi:MAG: RIO1 family regulatory kinase/ATPase [Candidatus Woesearchaeota archaeon]